MKTMAHVARLSRLLSGRRSVGTGGLILLLALALSAGAAHAVFRQSFSLVDQGRSGPGGTTFRASYITTPQFKNITIRVTRIGTLSGPSLVKPVLCRGGDLSGYKVLRRNFQPTTLATNVRDGVCFKLNFIYPGPLIMDGVISY